MSDEGQEVRGEAANSVSHPDEFRPSEKQLALLTAYQAADYTIHATDACTAAGVGRQTYYDWRKDAAFNRWWIQGIEQHFIGSLSSVYAKLVAIVKDGVKVSSAGQVAAAKLLLERFDKLYRPKAVVEHQGPEGIEQYLKRVAREQLEAEGKLSGQDPVDRPGLPGSPSTGQKALPVEDGGDSGVG